MVKINAKFLAKSLLCILLVGSMVACSKKTKEAIVEPAEISKAVKAARSIANKPFPQRPSEGEDINPYVVPFNFPLVEKKAMNTTVVSYYNSWKNDYIKRDQKNGFYIVDMGETKYTEAGQIKTTSEAIGYGMVITAYMAQNNSDTKEIFDGLYKTAKTFYSAADNNLMAWWVVGKKDGDKGVSDLRIPKTEVDGKPIPERDNPRFSATDGDMDIAYALLLADKQWGSLGAINYKEEALSRIKAIYKEDVNKTDFNLLIGDQAEQNDTHTRPSDFMPAHIKAFKSVDTANASGWQKVIDRIYSIVQYQYEKGGSAETGLMPDFMVKEGGNWVPVKGVYIESINDGDYSYNACRVPWRLGADELVTGGQPHPMEKYNSRWRESLNSPLNGAMWALTSFANREGGVANWKAGYLVGSGTNGTPFYQWDDEKNALSTEYYQDLAFQAPLGVSGMIPYRYNGGASANASKISQKFVTSAWNLNKQYEDNGDYFSRSINLQCMLVMSGNWWQPQN